MSMSSSATNAGSYAPGDRRAPLPAFSLGRRADGYQRFNDDQGQHDRPVNSAVEISPSAAVTRRVVAWNGMAAESVGVTQHGRVETRFRAPVHLLALFEAGERSDGDTLVEGLPRSELRNYRRKLIFVPAGHEYYDRQETRTLPRAAYFYFDPAALPLDSDTSSLAPRLFFEDAGLWDTAIKLKALIESPQAIDRLYCEALGVVLAHELVRLGLGARRVEPRVRGGLAAWQQRAAAGHIEEHLAEHVSLATLAQLVRLSPYHFSRAFKQSFGMPPHRFHTHRRIERAKTLLAKPTVSVTDVGLAIGFSGTSSFTTAFRKVTGLTPTDYHRSVS
jgi:AraC family transcriptional regulator